MSIGLLTINPAQQLKKNRDSHRKLDLKTIQSALEIYRSDQGSYPTGTTLKSGIITVGNCPTISPTSLTSDDTCADLNAKVYLDTIPKDPFTKKDYYYLPNDSGGYAIYSCLENTGVPSDPKSGDPEALSSATTPPVPDSGSDVDAVLNCNTYYGITNL